MEKRRALIVGTARDRGALAAARALHRAGWHVGVGTPDGRGVLTASKAAARVHEVPRPRGDGAAFVSGVRDAVDAGGYDIVFGSGDDWMAATAYYRAEVPVTVAHPPAEAVFAGLDKLRLTQAARSAGLSAPRTTDATARTVAEWDGPVVVKCREHWSPGLTAPLRIEARVYANADTARPRIDHIAESGARPVLQEPVRGRLGALIGLFHDGRFDGRVQQVTSRLWPTPSGVSSRARTVPVDRQLAEAAARMLGQLGWRGLVELQFLVDETGTAHLIDLNGRFYGSMALAEAARPGLVHTWALRELGEPTARLGDGEPGYRYAWSAGDVRRALAERRGGVVRDLAQTFR